MRWSSIEVKVSGYGIQLHCSIVSVTLSPTSCIAWWLCRPAAADSMSPILILVCAADREVQRILLELLNQMDGFDQTTNVKVGVPSFRSSDLRTGASFPSCLRDLLVPASLGKRFLSVTVFSSGTKCQAESEVTLAIDNRSDFEENEGANMLCMPSAFFLFIKQYWENFRDGVANLGLSVKQTTACTEWQQGKIKQWRRRKVWLSRSSIKVRRCFLRVLHLPTLDH